MLSVVDVCRNSFSCEWGGYVDPNNCNVCRCPDGFSGTTCQSLAPHNPQSGNLAATTFSLHYTST